MNLDNNKALIRNIEKAAIVLVVLHVVSHFSILFTPVMARLFGAEEYARMALHMHFLMNVRSIIAKLVSIGVAIWLYILAKRANMRTWIWLLFGLSFGVVAAILFFAVRIYECVKGNEGGGDAHVAPDIEGIK
ncbi:MAG: hypothetical protein KAT00_06235 [Planctomycetes bacterium]|nr:hypothetical protein [Planctomycetota bacterium]